MKDNNNTHVSVLIDWWDNLNNKKKAMALTILAMLSLMFMFVLLVVFPIVFVVAIPVGTIVFVAWILYSAIYSHLNHKERFYKSKW